MKRKITAADFEIKKVPKELKGLTSKILFDLFDIATKWGDLRADRMITFPVCNKERKGFLVAAHPKTLGLFVCKESEQEKGLYSTEKGALFVETKSKGGVIWDMRVSVREAEENIKATDEFFPRWIDPDTGERIQLPITEIRPAELRVSDVFKSKGSVFLVPPDIPATAEEVLHQFDHPELLEIVDQGPLKIIRLKDYSGGTFNAREVALREIMVERGISMKDIGAMSAKEIIALREEIEKRIKNKSGEA